MNDLAQLLAQLQRQRFYGSLEAKLEAGQSAFVFPTWKP